MVKLKDIARETGLTISTVSKALNRSPEISTMTTELVWEKAKEMGYFSRRVVDRRTKLVGVLLPEVCSHDPDQPVRGGCAALSCQTAPI